MSWENMEAVPQESDLAKDKIPCRLLSQLRNMAIPSPPSISSSSEDSDDVSEEDDENAALDYFFPGRKQDLASRLLMAEEDGLNKDFQNLSLVGPETQARLEALLEAAGVAADGKAFNDPEVLRRLTSSVSSALDEAAAALTRMRTQTGGTTVNHIHDQGTRSLVEACIDGDIAAVRKLLDEGRNVNEPTDEGESLLSLACSAGYYELVQVLLAMNANVEDRGSKGDCTPLMEASSGGFVDIVKLLLEHAANANAQSSSGNTALHYACCGGYEDVVEVLLSHNADLEHQNENGHTPLMEAASGGHVGVAKLLLDKGAGINTHSSEFKESALTLACYKGHVNMVKFLLEKGADQEHKTDEMHTALMEASMDGHVEVARLLLEHGAQVNMPADSFESPLTLAACGSHVELARLLIDHGANLEEVNDEGYTPLMEAAREGYLPMVDLLLEKGANINAQTEETQETALTLAACGGFQDVVDYLIAAGADIELGAPTPLMEASTEGHVELVRFLLDKGADVNAQTATGDTALTYACENGHTLVAEVLLKAGGDLEHEAEGGRTAVMKAARAGHVCTVDFLISQNAQVNKVTSNNDHSVLSLACAGGHTAVVKLLLVRGADPTLKLKDNSSMLIEAAKGGHTSVACLLLDSHLHSPLQVALPDSPIRSGFLTPVTPEGSPTGHVTPYPAVPHKHHHQLHQHPHQHECLQGRPHVPPLPASYGNHTCNFVPPPPVVQPAPSSTHAFSSIPTSFVTPPFTTTAGPSNPVTSAADVLPPNVSVSLPSSSLPLANLTPADLQSLAQALSFSASVNSLTSQDTVISTSATVAENLGISAAVNFPVIDPNLMGMGIGTSMGGVGGLGTLTGADDISCLPLGGQTTTVVTSGPRTVTSTGVQTEDALSMIHKLTNVQQLNALQNFAASHNLELVNLGEITLPPSPFPLNVAQEDAIMVAEPARPLQDTLAHITREEPDGGCSPPLAIPSGQVLNEPPLTPPPPLIIDIDQATESNHDTALTIACAGGHDELVQLLISKGADIEHRDKKGCTPLILSATAGHASTCRILLDNGSDIEAQSDRTKDTALSLACSSGRQEVVEDLLARGANYEHRNVSDYTPLSLAASGGYVGIIKVLLNHGAEINSRTGSKLGISPLMLAAMNGHVAAVKLLLDMGSDVNAQIETNRNTALTLACFQGRQEVVGLLLDRKAFVEHRAKTGLTPLMEAASGGYVEVGRVLVDRGADVNAPAVPSSRDTALTIAADKGHYKFVELLLTKGASIDVKNKKGCSPLWLAANGGHLDVVQLLAKAKADLDSQDNRGVSCLMAAFRKGHVKVVKWLVKHVTQFPADPDCKRFMQTISDKDLVKKLQECMDIIISAKERQAAEANKNASILLEELDHEKQKEARRRAAAAKKRDKKKRKKKRKAEQGNDADLDDGDQDQDDDDLELDERKREQEENVKNIVKGTEFAPKIVVKEERERIVMNEEKPPNTMPNGEVKVKTSGKKEKREKGGHITMDINQKEGALHQTFENLNSVVITTAVSVVASIRPTDTASTTRVAEITKAVATSIISSSKLSKPHDSVAISAEVAATMATAAAQCAIVSLSSSSNATSGSGQASSPKKSKRPEEGWKEVTRRSKKIQIPAALISRVIGRGGCNVNAIREYTGAHIDIDTNRKKPNGDCMVTIKGSQQATRQAYNLIEALIQDPEKDVAEILPARPRKHEQSTMPSVLHIRKPSPPTPFVAAAPKPIAMTAPSRLPSMPAQTVLSAQRSTTTVSVSHSQQSLNKTTVKQMSHSTAHRLPPRMGGSTSLSTTKAEASTVASPGWGGTKSQGVVAPLQIKKTQANFSVYNTESMSTPQQPDAVLASSIVTTTKSPAARQLFPPTTTSSTKTLPMPIGSNRPSTRPMKTPNVSRMAIQTTRVTRTTTQSISVDTEVVSMASLNSLFSQVATQARSPMIWNDLGGSGTGGETIASSEPSPPHHLLNGLPTNMTSTTSVVLSQTSSSSPSSFTKGMASPITSLSPSSSKSDSPTSLSHEERPHLNPIGCERAHKRTSSTSLPAVPGLPNFIPGTEASRQNVWGFGFPTSGSAPSPWPVTSTQGSTNWASTSTYSSPPVNSDVNGPLSGAELEDEGVEIRPDDTLQTLLERLSLSTHLSLFQKNEIDLDALMLMSEQDYADIGLSKGPRVKLLNSTRRLFNRNDNASPSSSQPAPSNHVSLVPPNQQQIWSGSPAVMSVTVPPVVPASSRPGPLLNDPLRYPPAQMMQPAWRPWSRSDR